MSSRSEVTTTPFTDGKIVQEVDFVSEGIRERVMREVTYTREKQVRDALIALGWTPPTGDGITKDQANA